ncbi:MAG: hypothetical protein JJU05_02810 [Verrucomicrobia bacterium]|nr:hypothetical protein [Verrucomicrobiota bacterium]MCH8527675.1 hypothetical protein [Kiritimatiellia bacterium]
MLVMLFLILGLNPLLKVISKSRLFLDRRQLALIFAMLLLACTIPTQGLLRMLPYTLAQTTQDGARNHQLAQIHQDMALPPSLFPDRIVHGEDTPAATYFLENLPEGEPTPWGAWIPPLLSWGALLVPVWMLMIGLGMIVYPQWRDNERLPFPILALEQSLIGDITREKRIPAIFKDKLFWFGAGTVLILYSFRGLNALTEGGWPGFPLGWDLQSALSEEPWRNLPGYIKRTNKLFFMLIGMVYFMPNRVSFSIWFTVLAYGVFQMFASTYAPPFDSGMIGQHRNGATLVFGLMVLYTGRHYWAKVGRSMVRPVTNGEESRNRRAGWLFVLGWAGMMAWLMWVGISPVWAFALVFLGFLICLVISRVVAETGLPFVRIAALSPSWLVGLFPAGMITAPLIYIAGFLNLIFVTASRISPAALMPHAMGMDPEATPAQQRRLPSLLLPLMILGLVVAGAVHLGFSYQNYASLDGGTLTGNHFGSRQMNGPQNQLLSWSRGAHNAVDASTAGQIVFGGALALGLAVACLSSPAWPLHPVGLLMVGTFYGNTGWTSIFIGWVLKMIILRYGGAGTYKKLRNLFIGLILGELLSALIWIIIPVFLILTGADPSQVGRTGILPN